jgi:hypothetical protein
MPGWSLRSVELLKRKHLQLGNRAFERGYRQKPHASGDRMFPHFIKNVIYFYGKDWRLISDPDCHEHYDPESKFYVDPTWSRYTGCDLAGKNRRGTVIYTIAVSPDGTRHVLDIKLGKWDGYNFGLNLEATFVDDLLRARKINVENNALQDYAIDVLREMAKHDEITCFPYIKGFHTGKKKMDPELGLPSIDVQYQNKRWVMAIPHRENEVVERDEKNTAVCYCPYCVFVRETSELTYEDIEVGPTPDTVMGQYFAKEASRVGERFSVDSMSVVKLSTGEIRKNLNAASPYRIAAEPADFDLNRVSGSRATNPGDINLFGRAVDGYSKRTYACADCSSYSTRRGFDLPQSLTIYCPNCNTEKQFR